LLNAGWSPGQPYQRGGRILLRTAFETNRCRSGLVGLTGLPAPEPSFAARPMSGRMWGVWLPVHQALRSGTCRPCIDVARAAPRGVSARRKDRESSRTESSITTAIAALCDGGVALRQTAPEYSPTAMVCA